jgi:hypothetical protein
VILDLHVVDLQEDLAVLYDLLLLVPAVAALRAEHAQVEAPGSVDVADDHHRLRPDRASHEASLGDGL